MAVILSASSAFLFSPRASPGGFFFALQPLAARAFPWYCLFTMVMPLDLLMGFRGNIYEMTCAAMKRGVQINLIGDEDLEPNRGKIVSTAIKQVLTQKVQYRFDA